MKATVVRSRETVSYRTARRGTPVHGDLLEAERTRAALARGMPGLRACPNGVDMSATETRWRVKQGCAYSECPRSKALAAHARWRPRREEPQLMRVRALPQLAHSITAGGEVEGPRTVRSRDRGR